MDKITIVTAFFDIGRGNYDDFKRSSEKYVEWFKRWSRIKNDLIVYLQDDNIIEQVKKIREEYGLSEKTKVIKVEDVFAIEKDIFDKWEKIEKDEAFIKYRDFKTNPENKAKYNYINLVKSYFMADVAKKYMNEGYVVWMDFGFEHGGKVFEDENDYSFEWKYDFGDKINLFYLNEIPDIPLFKIIKDYGPDCISGGILVSPKNLAEDFWIDNLKSAQTLAELGFMDDDQALYLMSYRRNPGIFSLHKSDWFMPIRDFGGEHFKVKPKQEVKISFIGKVKRKVKKVVNKFYGKE